MPPHVSTTYSFIILSIKYRLHKRRLGTLYRHGLFPVEKTGGGLVVADRHVGRALLPADRHNLGAALDKDTGIG